MFGNQLFYIFAKQTPIKTFVGGVTGTTLYRDFAGDKQLNGPQSEFRVGPDINFIRNSQATYVSDLSAITLANVNIPRFNYSPTGEFLGLLIEDQSTNLVQYSQDFTQTTQGWIVPLSSVTLTPNVGGIIAPDDTETATLLQPTTDYGFHVVSWNGTPVPPDGSPSLGEIYNRSIFVKKETARYIVISCSSQVSAFAGGGNPDFEGVANIFDFDNPGFTEISLALLAPTYEVYKDGWYRLNFKRNSANANTNRLTVGISNGPSFNDVKFAGTPGSLSGVYIWGAQVEEGPLATSYIPTNGAQTTRAEDIAFIRGTSFTTIYNTISGTYFTTVNHNGKFDSRAIATFISDNGLKYMTLGTSISGATHVFTNTSSPSALETTTIISKEFYNLAVGLENNNFVLYQNTLQEDELLEGVLPQPPFRLTRFELGQFNGTKYLNGNILKLGYYPYRLTNQQLSAL